MSGHSHFATIKRQKEANDSAKGKVFSKMARAISIAIRSGGSADPNVNYKLRMAIDTARTEGVPKDNIDRILNKSLSDLEDLSEVSYEGFGPYGVSVIVEAATNNKNRTAQEFKNLFDKAGGTLAGPGGVSFNFEPKGMIVVAKAADAESQLMGFIDSGAEDFEEIGDELYIYVSPEKLSEVRNKLADTGNQVKSFELIQKPKNFVQITDADKAKKLLNFIDSLDNHDDVQKVFSNVDIPENLLVGM
jgi:YebC/PmpR family DNA-binding regulatory protein